MLFIEREAPHNYHLSELREGYLLLNAERTEELEAEGICPRNHAERAGAAEKKPGWKN